MKNPTRYVQGIVLLLIFAVSAMIFQFQLNFLLAYCVSLFVGIIGNNTYYVSLWNQIKSNIQYLFL
jgi:site-specific recombinase